MGWPVALRTAQGGGHQTVVVDRTVVVDQTVVVDRTVVVDQTVEAEDGSRLIDAVVRAGLPIARACGSEGLCGRCAVTVLSGAGSLSPEGVDESRAKRRNRVDATQRLACQCRVLGPVEITARYW